MLAKTTKVYPHLVEHAHALLNGVVVSIDPSIGSRSSQPGIAVYISGDLHYSGLLEIDPDGEQWTRLQRLNYLVRKAYQEWDPDVLVYEDIPSQRHGGGNANSHASLLKAVGTILSISGPTGFIGLHPLTWKGRARHTYQKSDEADAIEIGWVALELARELEEERRNAKQQRNGKRKKKQSEDQKGGRGRRRQSTSKEETQPSPLLATLC